VSFGGGGMTPEYPCPGCGFLVLGEPPEGTFVICPVCRWEDCNIQFDDPHYDGGPNGISLMEHQQHVLERIPLTVREFGKYRRDSEWRPIVTDST
jgi:hypothetical protein